MDEEIEIIKRNKYGNGKEIFKKNGENERKLNKKIDVGKVGVNVKINVKMNMFQLNGKSGYLMGDEKFYGKKGVKL